jgi:hypothetical protein
MKKIYRILIAAFISTTLVGCEENLLEVPNENDPDFAKVYANGEDVENVASGLFNTAFDGERSSDGIEPMLATAADHATCSWGSFGMRDLSWEPRSSAWNNTPTYANNTVTKYTFDKWYSAIVTASNVIKAMDAGAQIGPNGANNDRTRAFAKYIQGLSYGNMALVFDRAHLVDETKTVEATLESASQYPDVASAAIAYLDEAIALSNGNFTIPAAWLGVSGDVSSATFKKMASTAAARILAYTPRNKADLAKVDWNKVKTYADNGITADWDVVMDAGVKWYFGADDYLTYPGWGRTDIYVVNLMDPTMPKHWEDRASFPHPKESTNPIDQRLKTDFEYLASNDFQAARGYYHFSCYRFKRYDAQFASAVGPKTYLGVVENDMLKAEARAYLGDFTGAAAIINAGTRISRGKMKQVAATSNEVLAAIHHERQVELYTAGMGLQFFEMRKLDLLQKGTPLHLPLPAATLQNLGLTEFYTFGTEARADGKGTSNGGWR